MMMILEDDENFAEDASIEEVDEDEDEDEFVLNTLETNGINYWNILKGKIKIRKILSSW